MQHTSLLARSGLWRVTRHDTVKRLYQRLRAPGVFVAQLDRLNRSTAGLDHAASDVPAGVKIEVHPASGSALSDLDGLDVAPIAPSDRIVVARRDGTPVGWCCLSDRPMYVSELQRRLRFSGAYLWRLYVRSGERGRGIGSAIIREAVSQARIGMDAKTISALVAPDNLPSRKAFHALGFTPIDRYTSAGCLGREWHHRTSLDVQS